MFFQDKYKAVSMTFDQKFKISTSWKLANDPSDTDLAFQRCAPQPYRYPSNPVCGGRTIQVWTWRFTPGERMELYCWDSLEFSLVRDTVPGPAGFLCNSFLDQKLGDVAVRYMGGGHWRPIDKDEPLPNPDPAPVTTQSKLVVTDAKKVTTEAPIVVTTTSATEATVEPTQPEVTTEVEPDNIEVWRKACNCWTAECGWCADLKCRVGHSLVDNTGITVYSKLGWKIYNTLFLFDSNGEMIGSLRFNKRGIFLTGGCVKCPMTRGLLAPNSDDGTYQWTVQFEGPEVVLLVEGQEVWRHELVGECAQRYSDIQEFAFGDMGCRSFWSPMNGAEVGSHFTDTNTCGTQCPF